VNSSISKRHNNRSSSESISDQRRALLLPQEITSLGADKEIVVMENIPPILANKIRYYEDPVFLTRLKRAAPSLKDLSTLPKPRGLLTGFLFDCISADIFIFLLQ
jgi:type IV secretion system protein VirD4